MKPFQGQIDITLMSLFNHKHLAVRPEFKVSMVQFKPVVGDPLHNASRMETFMRRAAAEGAKLVVFPELALNMYHSQDVFNNGNVQNQTEQAVEKVRQLAHELNIAVLFGHIQRNLTQTLGQKHLVNAASLLGTVFPERSRVKTTLPTYREFDEYRWFEPGDPANIRPATLIRRGERDISLGYVICEEGWNNPVGVPDSRERFYGHDPIGMLIQQNPFLNAIFNISASPGYSGKLAGVVAMNARMAAHYKVPVGWINTVGFQDELGFWGGTHLLNSRGELVLMMPQFVEDMVTFDLNAIDRMPVIADWEPNYASEQGQMEELDKAFGLYLNDYFERSGISARWPKDLRIPESDRFLLGLPKKNWKKIPMGGVVLGLSGGIDSTLVATIAAQHLGAERVLGVIMSSRYNTEEDERLAKELGERLGIQILVVPIEPFVKKYMQVLNLEEESGAHENIQARIRANILWAIANVKHKAVLNTTNFTEAARGYGTVGGDLLGLPMIASLPKTWVYRLASYYHTHGNRAITAEMMNVIASARLKYAQSDEVAMGAKFWVLDAILTDLFINCGNVPATEQKFLSDAEFLERYEPIDGNPDKRASLREVIRVNAKALLQDTQFKREYYNRTPQMTPYAWLRRKWPVANKHMVMG